MSVEKIDVVATWVDGMDPRHQAEHRSFGTEPDEVHAAATHAARFCSSGEVYYLIASLLRYAPFVNRVYLVTDRQRPKFLHAFADAGLCDAGFIRVVDHQIVFAGLDATLPTFSSRAIEAVLWRIPDLTEQFLYLNDDFFLNAPLSVDDFFQDGVPVLYGEFVLPESQLLRARARQLIRRVFGRTSTRPSFVAAQQKGASLAGVTGKFLRIGHHPHALRRSTTAAFYEEHPDVLRRQVGYRFRSIEQYSPISLANHLEITRHGVPVGPPRDVAYVRRNQSGSIAPALAKMRDGSAPFGCIQDFGQLPEETRARLRSLLAEKFAEHLPKAIRFAD